MAQAAVVANGHIPVQHHWIPSIDDFWDAVQRVKANFAAGFRTGIERTCVDIWHWVRSWPVWNRLPWDRIRELENRIMPIYLAIVHKIIELGEQGLDVARRVYAKVYEWSPGFVRQRLDWASHQLQRLVDRLRRWIRIHVDPNQLMQILRLTKSPIIAAKANGANGAAAAAAHDVDEVDEENEDEEQAEQMSAEEAASGDDEDTAEDEKAKRE